MCPTSLLHGKPAQLSIVIGSLNRLPFLRKNIESIRTNDISVDYEIIVVDGGSTDGSLSWLAAQQDIITIIQHNREKVQGKFVRKRSWGYFINLGFKISQGEYILMLSDDCFLLPGAVNAALQRAGDLREKGRKIGGVAFYFRNWPDEAKYYVQETIGRKLMVNHGLFLTQALKDIGWADEENYIFYKADGELNLNIWEKGYEIISCEKSIVEHYLDPDELIRMENNKVMDHDRGVYQERWKELIESSGPPQKVKIEFVDEDKHAEQIFGPLRQKPLSNSCATNRDE